MMIKRNIYIYSAVALFMAVLSLINFNELLNSRLALEAGDAPIYIAHQVKEMLHEGRFASANPAVGLGGIGPIVVGDFSPLFYYLLPESKVEEALMAFSAFWAAFFMFLFLRERRYGTFSSFVGGLSLGYSTVLLSIAKAGHTGKFIGIAYLAGSLWLMGRVIYRGKWIYCAFAGLFVGLALAQARDIIFITGIGLAAFWIKELIYVSKDRGSFQKELFLKYILAACIAVITAWPVLNIFIPQNDKNITVAAKMSDEQKWEWATQWSLPADELIKLISPSYCGWDSWDQKAPYWGRMGRSYGWEKTHQGFRNFTQTNEYIGVTVFILALAGIFSFISGRNKKTLSFEPGAPPSDTLFWVILGVVSLMLAMGKYFPLYNLFYSLPAMSSIRNPVKFMHIVCFAMAILSAQGMYVIEQLLVKDLPDRRRYVSSLYFAGTCVAIFLFLIMLVAPWNGQALNSRWLAEGFGPQVDGIKSAMSYGVLRSLLFSLALLIIFMMVCAKFIIKVPVAKVVIGIVVILLISWDFVGIGRKYVSYYDPDKMYRSNVIIDSLRDQKEFRVKFIPHTWGIFNLWNSIYVPFYFFKSADLPAESRRNPDLESFYTRIGKQPERLWKLMGVRKFVLPAEYENELLKILGAKARVFARFNLAQDQVTMSISPVVVSANEKAQFLVLENEEAIPCGKWYGKSHVMDFDGMINKLSEPTFDLDSTILISQDSDTGDSLAKAVLSGNSPTGICMLVEYKQNSMMLRSKASTEGWIFINDYFDAGWRGEVDGKSVTVVRANGVFRAIKVPSGEHTITMTYRANEGTFWVPFIVSAVLAFIAIALVCINTVKGKFQCSVKNAEEGPVR